jgi:YHS domain-containing protein
MGTPASIQFEGRELRFCCAGCVPEFQRDPRAYLKKIDGAVAEQQRPRYPIDTCVIDGKPLGVSPVELVHRDRLVRVCSEACRAAFVAAPEPALAALDREVIARQRPTYPLDVCPVSGEKLGGMGDPADYVFRGELVRFCCAGCVGPFLKDPAAALAKIRAAREAAAVPRPSATD